MQSELWQEPADLQSRDLFHGAGGHESRPTSQTYEFVARKSTGTNLGYEVRDESGRRWSVKLGDEAQPEVVASRVLWAVGFHQPPVYYVESWTLRGAESGAQRPARFRAESEDADVVGDWSWYANPFIGSRPFGGLVAVNLLLNNWDLKTANNKIYVVTRDDGTKERRYIVRDLGASLGKAHQSRFLRWMPFLRQGQGSKNRLDDFERQRFVRGASADTVDFDYRGLDMKLVKSVTPDDLGWACEQLERLTPTQWSDAFRAAGYSDDESARYIGKIRSKLEEARAVTGRVARGAF